jgi:hypothetical protein
MATTKSLPAQVANVLDPRFTKWLEQYVVSILNNLGIDVSSVSSDVGTINGSITTIQDQIDSLNTDLSGKLDTGIHPFDEILTQAATATAGPADASPASDVSAFSIASGADTIDRAGTNTKITTLTTEINTINSSLSDAITKLNLLKTAHDGIISKLQAAGIMS